MKRATFLVLGIILLASGASYWFWSSKNQTSATEQTPENIQASVAQIPTPPANPVTIPVLVYHSIAPQPSTKEGPLQRKYRVSPENFERQMNYLQEHGYTPIRFDHLAKYLLENVTIPEKPVVLTFDDGLANQYTYAAPILERFGFVGTFFVYPGVTNHRGFMTKEQVQDLVQKGHEIGSHTVIHYNLTTLTDTEKIIYELTKSKQMLEEMIDGPVTTLAYPHYAENEMVREFVQQAGYIAARAGWRAVTNNVQEIYHLKAQEVFDTSSPFTQK